MMPIFQFCTTQSVCLALAVVVVVLTACGVEAATIVVPPEFANVEANAHCCEGTLSRPGARFQELHEASEFSQMTSGPSVILQMAYRPDKDITTPRTGVWDDFELRLSTTDRGPGNMNSRFDDNFGADTTVVYSGDLTTTTQATGSSAGPHPFDYVIEFQKPFVYDPSVGNLLIDWRTNSITRGPYIDGPRYYDGRNRAAFSLSPSATHALVMFDAHNAVEFLVRELVRGDLNLDGEVDGLDVDPFVDVLLHGPFHIEADMNADGEVNGLDVDPFVAEVIGSSTEQIPEPSTLLLAIVALGVISGMRKRSG